MIDIERVQRRVIRTLVLAQILGGIGLGATVSVGALLAAEVSGENALSGMASTMSTLGAAIIALPLARLAMRRGRGFALAAGSILGIAGAVLATVSAALGSFPLLIVAFLLTGVIGATNLQARFAATDLAQPDRRGRQLSVVVWSTTIGAVLGPNLIGPGEALGAALGLPTLTGPFIFTVAAQVAATVVYLVGLRPDPLLTAIGSRTPEESRPARGGFATLRHNPLARYAVTTVALSHATMVAVMAMTPVHLYSHGATLELVGFALSLHIAGMFALSPVFGWLADRVGRLQVILIGQATFAASLLLAGFVSHSEAGVTLSVTLLGVGWSASVIAGSTVVAESAEGPDRAALQGVSDLTMNAVAALSGALAGPVLVAIGYSGLGFVTIALVGFVTVWTIIRLTAQESRLVPGSRIRSQR
ncbi:MULTISPECIES: MFS transporter [unclassified Cryobacterium]|uniref:MFS transporter n=1 Tax=unclassified Cryobacterium TaxID=2649013 RepID=UPI001444C37D